MSCASNPTSHALSAHREALYEATELDIVQCLCGHDPAVAKDEDNDGDYYEVECTQPRCYDADMRVTARTLVDAERAWADLVRSVERKMSDALELQRESFWRIA